MVFIRRLMAGTGSANGFSSGNAVTAGAKYQDQFFNQSQFFIPIGGLKIKKADGFSDGG